MNLTKMLTLATRCLQVLFGAIVLVSPASHPTPSLLLAATNAHLQGLSVKAIKWQVYGSSPAAHGYATFSGALALLLGLGGFAATFISTFNFETPLLFADGVATAMLMGGGISYAVQMRHVDCRDDDNVAIYGSKLLNGGCKTLDDGETVCGFLYLHELQGRCRMLEADTTFVFLAFAAGVGAVVLGLIGVRKAGRGYVGGSFRGGV